MSHVSTMVLATHNRGKLVELHELLAEAGLEVEVLGLDDLPANPVPEETGGTFEENALIKARDAALRHGLPALADDSGLEVDALGGMPGIRSARWAGRGASDEENLQLLLRQVDDLPPTRRRARFVSAVALVVPTDSGLDEHVVRGTWEGRLATEPAGANGFGYDPIFLPDDAAGTSAELSPEEKNARSHRAKAFAQVVDLLVSQTPAGVLTLVPPPEDVSAGVLTLVPRHEDVSAGVQGVVPRHEELS